MFARVAENGGYFVSRIKKNMDPVVVFSRGRSA
jgi:putative transposase